MRRGAWPSGRAAASWSSATRASARRAWRPSWRMPRRHGPSGAVGAGYASWSFAAATSASCNSSSGSFRRRAWIQRRARAINEAFYGPEHPDVARTLANLAEVQRTLGDFEGRTWPSSARDP